MDATQRIAINAGLGFFLAAALAVLFGESIEIAVLYGVIAAAVFALGIWLLGRFEDRRTA